MKHIKGNVTAWITKYGSESSNFEKDKPESYAYTNGEQDMTKVGWTRVGDAEITLLLRDDREIVANMVSTLKAEKQRLQADTQVALNKIDERIQSLLALTAQV